MLAVEVLFLEGVAIVDHVGRAETDCWVNDSIKGMLNVDMAVPSLKGLRAYWWHQHHTWTLGRSHRHGPSASGAAIHVSGAVGGDSGLNQVSCRGK